MSIVKVFTADFGNKDGLVGQELSENVTIVFETADGSRYFVSKNRDLDKPGITIRTTKTEMAEQMIVQPLMSNVIEVI